ncbi:MAG TPA: enoyl-CoA hydratase [Myxococcota bacterium]|jgi:enoyl-CoA hydratase/carnithine racemase
MTTPTPVLLREDKDGVATLTLNRPEQFNSLSEALIQALQLELERVAADDAVRVVVLAGAGRAFCAGHDLREMRANPRQSYYEDLFARCGRMMQAVVALPKPVIARVHGVATAAGAQLVASCDLAIASDNARFGTTGINLGLFCSTPSVAVSRAMGRKRSFELLFTGDLMDAKSAEGVGLVNRVVPLAELDAEVARVAQKIAAQPASAVRIGKEMFYRQLSMELPEAYRFAGDTMAANMMEPDAVEGIDAFLAKREPSWKKA